LGKIDAVLVPNDDFELINDYKEHGIDNFRLYQEGFSCEKKSTVLCMTRRFMVAPDGDIYKCHYHLYSRRNALGNIKDLESFSFSDYELCNDFGFCNPCDFPHASFRSTQVHLQDMLSSFIPDFSAVDAILDYYNNKTTEEFKITMEKIMDILYRSADLYWELYNNQNLRKIVNDYLNDAAIYDNTKESFFAQFDGNLFRYLRNGLNIYRILDDIPLYKYLDASSKIVYNVLHILQHSGKEIFKEPFLIEALDSYSSTTQSTWGAIHETDGSFVMKKYGKVDALIKKEKEKNEREG
jgi:hypothetical protein